jgi:cytochrome c2
LGRALAAIALLLALAGCGTGGRAAGGDPTSGKALFVNKCAGCHTLADASSKGTQGPNLDDSFRYVREQHYEDSTIADVVWDQIQFPSPPMPANLARGQQARDIAAYVAQCAARKCNVQAPATALAGGGKGGQLYSSLACAGCHSLNGSKSIGPTFKGLFGSKVKLSNGQTVTADEAYLLQSIEDPDAQIVMGFAKGVMSSAVKPHSVSQADAKALVDFIKSQK